MRFFDRADREVLAQGTILLVAVAVVAVAGAAILGLAVKVFCLLAGM